MSEKAREILLLCLDLDNLEPNEHGRKKIEKIAAALDAEYRRGWDACIQNATNDDAPPNLLKDAYRRGLEEAAEIAVNSKASADPIEIARAIRQCGGK